MRSTEVMSIETAPKLNWWNRIANPGQLQVEVKSTADPTNWYSNRVILNVTAPPVPSYRYTGLIVKNGVSLAVIRDESESDLNDAIEENNKG